MTIKPILFSGSMVRAILAGKKTQTRRVVKPPFELLPNGYLVRPDGHGGRFGPYPAPYQPGDTLWVRETWREWDERDVEGVDDDPESFREWTPPTEPLSACFRADCGELEEEDREAGLKWRPSIFMPKHHCRLFLKVTGVRVQRLQDITVEDILAEGLSTTAREHDACCHLREQWEELWDSINAARGFGFDTNPWVWVYEFKRTHKPEGWPS